MDTEMKLRGRKLLSFRVGRANRYKITVKDRNVIISTSGEIKPDREKMSAHSTGEIFSWRGDSGGELHQNIFEDVFKMLSVKTVCCYIDYIFS